MSREDEAYKSLRRRLNKEQGTKHAYKAQTGNRTEQYISENPLGNGAFQTRSTNAEAAAFDDARRDLYKKYGPPRRPAINPFDGMSYRTPGAQALWDLSQQGITQNRKATDPADRFSQMGATSLHQIGGLPGAVQQKRIEEYKESQAAPGGMGSFDDMAAAITADKQKREKAAKEALDMRPSYMKQQGQAPVPQDQLKTENFADAWNYGSNMEGSRNKAKTYNEYLDDLKAGRTDAGRFDAGVEKGRQNTRNGLDISDAEQVQSALGGGQRVGAQETTAMLTDQEKQNYYYIAGTQGKNDAENYRQYVIQNRGLNEQIAKRNQEAIAREMAYQTPTDRFLFESGTQFLLGAGGALENMSRVPAALTGDTSYRAEGVGQHLSQGMTDAIDTSTLAGRAYKTWQQLMNTSGNNAVSIAGGVAFGPGVGSALFAAQAAGDAYQQVINEGGTVWDAQFFAGMQAIDEEVTNALLGGIAARGGGLLKNLVGRTPFARTIQSAMKGMFTNNPVGLRIANGVLDALANGGSEALQEYVQYFSEKFEKWLATGEAPTFNVDGKAMTWDQIVEAKGSAAWDVFANPEALESALMGFLNAGLMNGIGSVGRTADAWNRGGALSQDSYQSVLDMVDPNITHYRSEDTYRAGKEAIELARDQQRRVESGQGDSIMSRYGRGLMSQAAEEYQRQYAKNETAGRAYYNPDQVKALIAENDRKNRALRRLAFGGETAVDKLERIRSELAGETAQAAWEAPQEDYGVREVTIPAEMHEQYAQDMLNRGSADRLEWEGDSGEMVSLQREDDGYYTFTNERGETVTLDPDQAIDLIPSGQPIKMYDNAGSTAVETEGTAATPWAQNGTAAPSTVAQAPSTAAAAQTTAPSTAQTTAATGNGVAISQQGAERASGTDRLAQLADEAGKQTVEQREAQRNAIYEAGKNRDSDFQAIMDGATMLSEAEKTAAFNKGMQDSLNEVRMEGQNNGRTEEGNLVSGEGSGRNISLRAGEQTSGIPQAAGRDAETGNGRGVLGEADRGSLGEGPGRVNTGRTGVASGRNRGFRNAEIVQNLERAADKEVRNATADMIEVGEVAPARDLLRTAVPGQTLVPVFGGKTYSLRKADAMVQAYDKNIMMTPFISSGEIMVGGGESSRAFADPVRRQLGFRLNDEDATGIQLTKHELIEFGIMDGKISVDQAFDILSSKIPQRYIDAIVGEYFSSSTKGMTLTADQTENAFRHAMKEIICDIGAGIDQISGRIKDEKARRLFEAVHQRANKALTSYLNERLNNAFDAEPAAETAEASSERVELTSEAMTDGVASDGITMEGEDSIQLSEKLYKESGRDFLRNWLAEQEDISQEDKDDIVAQVDHIYDIMQQIKEEAGKDGILDYRAWAEVAERNGRLTVITPNGEYPLNIDFATVCKKRKALDYILNTMVVDGNLEAKDLANADIVRLQNLIKSEGFEIACALCFVDSKRYRIGSWADGLVNGHKSDGKWQYGFNELVRSLVPKGSNLKIDQFNYTGRDVKQPRGRLLKNAKDSQLDFTLIDEVIAKNAKGTWNRNLATAIKEHPELRSLLNSAELLSSVGFDPIKAQNPALFDVINNKGGTSKPKLSFSEVPYLNDILMSDAMTPEAAYAVGGVRIQSFSDFMANMVFDYVQMVSELQAKKLPAHAYTKEAAFVAMFGKTGIKINMSLVPKASTWTRKKINSYLKGFKGAAAKEEALNKLKQNAGLDEHGNYIWEDESFPYEVAMHFQADPEYAKNCGTIAVGVSDRHIIKLLNDDRIQMVIPYHKSGINPVVARLRNIDLYNDYTNYQNTRYADGTKLSSSDNTFDFYGSLKETGDPKKTAKEYLAWCKKNGYIPKFGQFKGHPNYYKLLADFRLYDDTGAYAPQGAVKGNYPDNMKDLILNGYSYTDENGKEYHNGGLLDAQKVSDALREKTRDIIDRYNAGEGKVQNSSKLGSGEIDISSSTESEEDSLQTKINSSMTMDQAKRMVQQAFNIGDIKAWFDGEYKNGDEWLAGEGSEAVALIIDNDYTLQQKYINKVQGILDGDFTIEDVLDAYSNQSLTGTVKEKKSFDVDLSKSAGYTDNRFYAPRMPSVTAETFSTANMRTTASNREQVNKARLDILIAAHNDANIVDKLGITKTELNKKLRTWSRYSANAMSLAERLNKGVALENQWSGLQNCSIISQMNVTDDDINSMVKSATGTSRGYERNYIAKAILAADTHTDWSWLNFEFKAGRADENRKSVLGTYNDQQNKVTIGGNADANTVAHEMGHALASKWACDLMGVEPGHGHDLAEHLYNESYIKDPEAKKFAKHFDEFMDSLTDVNDIRSEYTNRPGEVFARFFAKFVEWTNKTAGNYYINESKYYKDRFTQSQYTEFVKLLQEKAALDAKRAVAEETTTPDVESAAEDPNNMGVIRQGSEKDVQYSSRLFDKDIDDRLKVRMASFFSGGGTVDFALRNIVSHEFAVELNDKIAAIYRANNGENIYIDDVTRVNINPHKGRVEYFHASPVCTNFSGANNNAGEKPLDKKTAKAVAKAIKTLNPKVITVENVAKYMDSDAVKIIEKALHDNGYIFDKAVYRATEFGGATIRERMFLRAVKENEGVLPPIKRTNDGKSWYSVAEEFIDDLPEMPLSNYMKERLEPSGIDIKNLKQPVLILGGNKGEKLTYAYADKPSPTILANSSEARIIMPNGKVLRAVPRVLARIQGLPKEYNLGLKDDYDMQKSWGGVTRAYTIVGNGVPVELTQGIVGPLLEENLIKQKSEATGIQYSSKLNSDGNKLTEAQAEYFKDSKVQDEKGRLKKMYHGTTRAGFTVFNPARSDDNISLFFTDRFENAREYSGGYDTYNPDFKYGFEDLKKAFDEMSEGNDELRHVNGKYQIWSYYTVDGELHDERVMDKEFSSLKEAQAYLIDEYYSQSDDYAANYEVYLNIKDPLIVDADGHNWDEIPYFEGEEGELIPTTTREIAEDAKEMGYDGVIINNVWDNGPYAERQGVDSNIAIAFNSNQVKSIYNLNPTENDDIRYSSKLQMPEGLTEKQQKNFLYNQKKTKVGDTLMTLNGSRIGRSKYGVGKDIGGQYYVHKDYAEEVIPGEVLSQAKDILKDAYPNFKYNAIMYQPSKNSVRFDEAPDFDTAREPMVGTYVTVDLGNESVTLTKDKPYNKYIWHHKWQWVHDDYEGFDVAESWNWSKQWLSVLRESSNGNGIKNWNAQLDKYGLPHDGDVQYSGKLKYGQEQTGEDTSMLQIPKTFTHFEFPAGTRILDYGGGQYNLAKDAVERTYPGVSVEIMDAFNRTSKHNDRISDMFDRNKADVVTVNNVLNVINSREARHDVIEQAKRYLKKDGVAYFLNWQADAKAESGLVKGKQKDKSRRNYQTNMEQLAYKPEIKEVFDYVTEVRSDGDIYLLASNVPLTEDMYKLSDENSPEVKYLRNINKGDKTEKAKYNVLSQRYGEATVEILDSEYENAANKVLDDGSIGDNSTIKKIVDHLAVREDLDKKTVRDLYKVKRDADGNVIPLSQRVEIHDENIRYSSSLSKEDYAPTFYSKLQREVQNFKGEKIGAASVESYLKGKGVKDEEIKWSGIRTFLEGKRSVGKAELMDYLKANEFQIEVNTRENPGFVDRESGREFSGVEEIQAYIENELGYKDYSEDYDDYMDRYSVWIDDGSDDGIEMNFDMDDTGTKWGQYKLDGGENYREILFEIPGSDYINTAMNVHWNQEGVLAHARVQDFESNDGGKVLFIEEIQSDWHNAGQKHGYGDDTVLDKYQKELDDAVEKELLKEFDNNDVGLYMAGMTTSVSSDVLRKMTSKANEIENKWKQDNQEKAVYLYEKRTVPDAPFRTTYTDYVLKNLLRMAAEGDYDYLAWTAGKMQEERWSGEFAEGYRIEYDQQIPKFLKKYGKQWGANLTEIGLWTSDDAPQDVDSKIREFVEAIKEYDKDATYESVRSEMPGLVGYAVSLMEEDDPNWDRITGLAREIENAEFMNSGSERRVPAITVNDAMKNSVLTEGQPMYSSKNTGEIDEKALDPRRVFISYNPDLQNAVREISDVLTAYQELAPTQAEIKRTTRQIAKKFGSHINVEVAARKMETLYNFLAGGGKPDGREVLEISMDIANDILDEATHGDPDVEERWKKFKQEMRKRWIYVPKDRVRDLNPDGIKALRKQWKGKMVFTTDEKYRERYGQIHYIELQQMFPEYFTKNADNMNDIEAIEEIMFAFDAQAPVYEQIYTGATRDEAALEIAYDIMQGYFGNDRAKDRFKKIYRDYVKPIKDRAIDEYRDKLRSIELKDAAAVEQRTIFDQIKGMRGSYVVNEKALKDVDAQGRRAMLERVRERAERDKKRYEEQIEKVKAGYVERSQKDRLMRLAKELRAMKGGPEFEVKKKELIGDLDLIAKGISYNYERKLMDMKDEYEKLAEEDPNFEPDRGTLQKIERLKKKQINQMTSYEITALTEAILKMKQDQWTHNRMIRETDAALVADEGRKIVNETNALKGTKGMNRLADAIDGYSLAHLNSKRAFKKMSGYNDKSGLMKLWNELNEGQHKTMDFRRRAVSPFDAFMSEEENKDFITGMFEPTVEITSSKIEIEDENGNIVRTHEPQTVKITPAMKISIYLHSLNQDNREHARYGGFRIPNMDKYERGDYSNAYGQGSKIVRLTKADMQNIASTMTPQELRFADLAYEYFNKTSKEAINEASMLLNGYELASVENYMPIKTDPNFTKKDMSGLMQDGTIEGQGWTKDRNFMAKNPILLEDITQVLQRSIDGAALYYGLAIPIRNFNKVYNFQHRGYTDSVKEAIMQTFGKRGNEYIEKLLRDLQGGNMDTKDAAGKWVDRFTSGLRGNYAQAILTLNPSVAIKQAASYPTAAARLGFEPLKKALAKLPTSTKEDMDIINKYTPLLWYRTQGQSSDALAEVSKRKEAWEYKGGVEKTRQMFNWIQNIDVKTVKTLWYASEYYVQDNMPSFKEGTEAYYREVAKVFNEVVEDTQPNYTTMQRASISRVDNEIMKAVFMFKTQPLQNVGILYDSIMEYQAKQEAFKQAVKNGFEGDALNEYAADMAFARQGMMRSVASITVSTLVFSAMTQLAKLLLHRVDPLRDEGTGELTKASILKNFFGNAAESVAGMLAGAGEIYSLIMAMTTGSYLDNLSVSGIDSLNDTMTKMLKTYQNIGKIWEDEEATPRQKTAASIVASRDLAIQIMDLTGIPANNAKKIAEALINHYHDVINPIFTGRPIDTNLESGARITDKQYANRALKYYQKGNIAKGDLAVSKMEKESAMQWALGAKGKKDEKGNTISNSKKYDAIHRILRTPGPDEAKGKMYAAAYPSDELARYMYGGGSAYDFMVGQMLAEEIAALSEEERKKKLYSFVEETGYTLEQKKAWLVSDKDRIESKTLTAWRDANGTDWDYIKHMSNLEKFNGSKEKKEKVVAYIKRQTTDTEKRKALFLMAGYKLDSTEDGKTIKDGNFKKAMGY